MPTLDKIQLPSGSIYDIEDSYARREIESLRGVTINLGVTTTMLVDGSDENPIVINDEEVFAFSGNIVTYNSTEFLYNGTIWQEFGPDLSGLKSLAYQDDATGEMTPSGTVSKPSFIGLEDDIIVTGTPSGNVSVSPTVTLNKTVVNSITDVGTLPECTFPELNVTVQNKVLVLGWTEGTFNEGTLPTKGQDTSVATDVDTATATATFEGDELSAYGRFTPSGEVSQPTFSGDTTTVTVS